MSKYIGITIGPIFDTMNLSSSPCALWASSYIFSFISKSICEKLVENGIEKDSIISPCFNFDYDDELKKAVSRNDGTGLFHDRIIFEKPENFDLNTIKSIKADVIKSVNKKFDINNEEYLKNYIMISAAEYKADNPILGSTQIFDCLELSKSFVIKESNNPILDVFTSANTDGSDDKAKTAISRNDSIKSIVETKLKIENWQLFDDDEENTIKDLGEIACSDDSDDSDNSDKKYKNYFAVVRSDGDNMSKIISSLSEKADFKHFSSICLKYCAAVADKVKEFGGVTIYAGGDDLLALIPCKKEKDTVFDFIKGVNGVFEEKFRTYIDKIKKSNEAKADKDKTPVPSLSFGIMICYEKYPLYEALKYSADLLFDKAKSVKNCSVINLQKHSGQSVELLIPNSAVDKIISLQNEALKETDKTLLSALHKISLFEILFNQADNNSIEHIFINTFDAASHKDNDFVHKTLPNAYEKIVLVEDRVKLTDDKKDSRANAFSSLMRIMKFYVEKGGKK